MLIDIHEGVMYTLYMPRKKKMPEEVRAYFIEMGRQGGKIGGSSRAAKMTKEERSEAARKAVLARWAKKNGGE
jgi:hypothetical protein